MLESHRKKAPLPLAMFCLAVLFSHLDDYALNLGVGLEAVFAQFSADARLFETAKWSLRFQDVVAVNPA